MSRNNARIHPSNPSHNKERPVSNEWDDYAPESLAYFKLDSPFRQRLLQLCKSGSKFDSFILVMILMNTIIMACVDYRYVNENYEPVSDESLRNYLIEKAEIFFMILFIVECAMKIIAWGFMDGDKSYIKSSWNVFDFGIVLCRYVHLVHVFCL